MLILSQTRIARVSAARLVRRPALAFIKQVLRLRLVVGCQCVFPFTYNRNLSLGAKAEIASDKLTFTLKNHTRRSIARMMSGNKPEKV